jgi:hypothetical protein
MKPFELEIMLIDLAARNKAVADMFFSYIKANDPPVIYSAFLKEYQNQYFASIEAAVNVFPQGTERVVLKKHLQLLKKVFLTEQMEREKDE